ncbi:MAG: DMT family transporter, partial [Pseudorhodoplanes sp.]
LATLIMLPFAWNGIRTYRDTIAREWRYVLLVGFIGITICGGLVYVALTLTTATHTALIYTVSPVMIVIAVAIVTRRMPPGAQFIGIFLAIAGVAVTATQGELDNLLHLDFNRGDIFILFCACCWAVYSLLLKRGNIQALPASAAFCLIMMAGALLLTPLMIYETVTLNNFPATLRSWTSIVAIAVFASVFSYGSYQHCVRVFGPAVTGIFLYLLPAYGIVLAVIFLAEVFRPYHAVGLLLSLGGVLLATGSNLLVELRRRRQNPGAASDSLG